jgi:flagellar protein FliL
MSEPEKDEAEAPAPKPKKGKSKLLLLGVPVFVLLMGGGAGAWWYFNQPAGEGAEAAHEEAEEETKAGIVPLDSFIVNLADPGGRKYLRANVLILVPDEAEAKEIEENKLVISRVRSAVIEVLAKRTSAELLTAEGRAALKHDIAETAKEIAHIEVKDVLFEEFIVQ